MIKYIRPTVFCLVAFGFAVLFAGPGYHQQALENLNVAAAAGSAPGGAADSSAQEAAEYRANAALMREMAGRWRALALHERAVGARSRRPHLLQAAEHAAQVDEEQARRLDAGADDFERAARDVEAAAAKAREEPGLADAQKAPGVEDFLGVWRHPDDASELKIEPQFPQDPARNRKLLLKTRKNRYTGEYLPGENPQTARLAFSRSPTAPEMNKEIPQLGRVAVAGKLLWELHVHPENPCDISEIETKWYPGEVSWPEDDPAKAAVTGKGEPITLRYKRPPPDDLAMLRKPVVFIRSPDLRRSRYLPFTSVAQGQPFIIEVLTPGDDHSPPPASLTVSLRGGKSGTSAQVILTGERQASGVHHYRPANPVVILNPSLLGIITETFFVELYKVIYRTPPSFLRGPPPGAVNLPVENGEEVVATFGEAKASFRVYDDVLELAVAALTKTLDDAAVVYQALLFDGSQGARTKRDLEYRLKLVANARALMAYFKAQGSGAVPRRTRLAITAAYIALLGEQPSSVDLAHQPAPPDEYGVVYASDYEQVQARHAIFQVRNDEVRVWLSSLKDTLDEHVSYAALISEATGFDVGRVKIAFTGLDLEGQRVDRMERVGAAINVGLTAFVNVATAFTVARGLNSGAAAAAREGEQLLVGRAASSVPTSRAGGIPAELLRKPFGIGAEQEAAARLGHLLPSARVDGTVRIVDKFRKQCHKYGCALKSFLHGADEALGGVLRISETEATGWAARMGIFNPLRGTRFSSLKEFAARFGARSGIGALTLTEIKEFLDKGKKVLVGIRTTGSGSHAVRVIEVIKDAKGVTQAVRFYDPAPGAIVRMSACEFRIHRAGEKNIAFVFDFGPR